MAVFTAEEESLRKKAWLRDEILNVSGNLRGKLVDLGRASFLESEESFFSENADFLDSILFSRYREEKMISCLSALVRLNFSSEVCEDGYTIFPILPNYTGEELREYLNMVFNLIESSERDCSKRILFQQGNTYFSFVEIIATGNTRYQQDMINGMRVLAGKEQSI
ncbi:MAG: hypothetical protein AB9915_03745 [Candidatus Dojkabacteria bacterium]